MKLSSEFLWKGQEDEAQWVEAVAGREYGEHSASKDKSGKVHISICNLDPQSPAEVACLIEGVRPANVSGRVLTADAMTAHNTFDNPQTVKPAAFDDFTLKDNMLTITLPAKSVVVIEIGV